jgi:hypothetical protein
LLARKRQLGPNAFAHDLCHSEFVLQDLSVSANLMELSVQLLAFSFPCREFLLQGCELESLLFGHSPNDATPGPIETVQYCSLAGCHAFAFGRSRTDSVLTEIVNLTAL